MAPSKKQPKQPKAAVALVPPAEDTAKQTVRTSLALPLALDENLNAEVLHNNTSKSEVLTMRLTELLPQQGYHPDECAKLAVSD